MNDRTHEPRKCAGHSSQTGLPCKKWPIQGGTVCRWHGGAAPQVRRKAEERIRELVNPALAALARLIGDADAGREGAESEAVRLAAARDILDRAGYVATQRLAVSGDLTVRSPVDLELDDLAQKLREHDRERHET